ncbi:hypothetical protein N9C08_04190, partial [Rubripirellula sp.]|nr:hypothetical protein [Rubripirellula sp.]
RPKTATTCYFHCYFGRFILEGLTAISPTVVLPISVESNVLETAKVIAVTFNNHMTSAKNSMVIFNH